MHKILLSGGLGNQMFQYAFYLSMKERGVQCKIDTTLYDLVKMHNGFEISHAFGIDYLQTKPSSFHKFWIKLLRKYRPKLLVFSDRRYQYCPDAYDTCQRYLIGDWINIQYFDSIAPRIKSTYVFKNIKYSNLEIKKMMEDENSVSIHIRRGDYLKLPNYCVCNERYYESAVNYIICNVDSPVFYVFSNDHSWCKMFMSKLNAKYVIVDNNQGIDSYQDMYLMTKCKHNIIANSTFSWWGAWLNQNEDKIVVAPQKWFRHNDNNANCVKWHLINNL